MIVLSENINKEKGIVLSNFVDSKNHVYHCCYFENTNFMRKVIIQSYCVPDLEQWYGNIKKDINPLLVVKKINKSIKSLLVVVTLSSRSLSTFILSSIKTTWLLKAMEKRKWWWHKRDKRNITSSAFSVYCSHAEESVKTLHSSELKWIFFTEAKFCLH